MPARAQESGNGTSLSFKSIINAASYLVQAALIGLVSMFFHWISTQNEVNTATAISLKGVEGKLVAIEEAYKDLKVKCDKVEEREQQLQLEFARAGIRSIQSQPQSQSK